MTGASGRGPECPLHPEWVRLSQWCDRSRNKDMEKAGGTLDAQLWTIKRAEPPEVPIALVLTEGAGWTASQSLRWTDDGSGVWRVLLFRMSMLNRPMRQHLDRCSPLTWKSFTEVLGGRGGTYSKPLLMSLNLESIPFHWHPEQEWRRPEKRKHHERKHGGLGWTQVFWFLCWSFCWTGHPNGLQTRSFSTSVL